MVRETIVELELPLGPSSDSLTIESLQKRERDQRLVRPKGDSQRTMVEPKSQKEKRRPFFSSDTYLKA